MAFTGRATYDDFSVEHYRDLSTLVQLVGLDETPFLAFLGDPREPAYSTRREWHEHYTWYWRDTITEGATFVAGVTTLTVKDGSRFEVGMVILIDDELLLVTAISTNDLTVTRGYGGTTDADHADGTTIYILSKPALEGEDVGTPRRRSAVQKYNYTQIFRSEIVISGSEMSVRHVGLPGASILEDYRIRGMREVMRDLERAAINGYYHSSTPQGSSSVRRTMGGLRQFVTNTTDAGGAALSESTHLRPALRSLYKQGSRPDLILASPYQADAMATFLTPFRSTDMFGTQLGGRLVTYVNTLVGPMAVLPTPHLVDDEMFILDTSKISVIPLVGRGFQFKPVAQTGDAYKELVIGEYTMEVQYGSTHHARIFGLATS